MKYFGGIYEPLGKDCWQWKSGKEKKVTIFIGKWDEK